MKIKINATNEEREATGQVNVLHEIENEDGTTTEEIWVHFTTINEDGKTETHMYNPNENEVSLIEN